MEKEEFTVDTSDWKVFYKMKYSGEKGSLIAFSSMVAGTCCVGAGNLEPAIGKAAETLAEEFSDIRERLEKLGKSARKHLKKQDIGKDPYLEMFVVQKALQNLGAVNHLDDKRAIKKALKDI